MLQTRAHDNRSNQQQPTPLSLDDRVCGLSIVVSVSGALGYFPVPYRDHPPPPPSSSSMNLAFFNNFCTFGISFTPSTATAGRRSGETKRTCLHHTLLASLLASILVSHDAPQSHRLRHRRPRGNQSTSRPPSTTRNYSNESPVPVPYPLPLPPAPSPAPWERSGDRASARNTHRPKRSD